MFPGRCDDDMISVAMTTAHLSTAPLQYDSVYGFLYNLIPVVFSLFDLSYFLTVLFESSFGFHDFIFY